MIHTCTMNPAIDIVEELEHYLPHVVNRALRQDIQPNGKGVNISFVLKMLGFDSVATGFSAGFTGRFVEEELEKKGIRADFVHIEGITRLNVFTRVYAENTEYKLVNPGPSVTPADVERLLDKVRRLGRDDVLCVSGSTPGGVPDDIYIQLARLSEEQGFRLALDTNHPSVPSLAFARLFLIKPNIDELAEWAGKPSLTRSEAAAYGRGLAQAGFAHVLVSLGEEGAMHIDTEKTLYANAPRGKVVNTACAGDTLMGTFLAGLLQGKSLEENLAFAVAAGSSTAFRPGLTDYSDVVELTRQIKTTVLH